MNSNAAIERLINAVMALDGRAENSNYAVEMRCLLGKIDWVATEAEAALKRCASVSTANRAPRRATMGLENAA